MHKRLTTPLFSTALVVLLPLLTSCKNPPSTLQELGERIDDTATRAVEGLHEALGNPRSLPPEEEGEEPAVKQAREAYEAGKIAYQTARYIEAVDKFQESFEHSAKIEDAELQAQVQSSLYYNLGQAHIQAYELDKDATRLRQAKALLQNHLDSDPSLSDQEREQARTLIAEADAKLAELEAPPASEGEGEAPEGEAPEAVAESGDGASTPPAAEAPSPE